MGSLWLTQLWLHHSGKGKCDNKNKVWCHWCFSINFVCSFLTQYHFILLYAFTVLCLWLYWIDAYPFLFSWSSVAAMLEQDTIPGVLGIKPTGFRKRSSCSFTLETILKHLDSFHSTLLQHGNDAEVIRQVLKQQFYIICATTLNNLLLRKDMCSWSKGLQIRYWPQGLATEQLHL